MKSVLFLGRKKWAALALDILLKNNYKVIGTVGMQQFQGSEDECPTASYAKENNIPVYSHLDLYRLLDLENRTFDGKKLDIVISYLFPLKLKKELLQAANTAAVNFHPAPLPDYQGLGGYNAAIMDDRDYYGVTAHHMTESIDAGEILKVKKFNITDTETAWSLEQKSMEAMFELFTEIFSGDFEHCLKHSYKNDTASGRYINRKEFEAMKYVEPDDTDEIINKKIRAFWYPPYEGAKVQVGGSYYTLVDSALLDQIAGRYKDEGETKELT